VTLPAMLATMVALAESAAAAVQRMYESESIDVDMKGPDDPVTSADRIANALLCEGLARAFPGCPVVAEESPPEQFGDYQHAPQVFFVDPVDGTRELVRRTGEFVVMIGCLQGERAAAGVIVAPVTGTTWAGSPEVGAVRRVARGPWEPIRVSSIAQLDCARVLVSRARPAGEHRMVAKRLGAAEITPMGSAGIKGVRVACGDAEAYVAPVQAGKRWDTCALDAIVGAAGGRVTDARGVPLAYRSSQLRNDRGLVAANAELHAEIVAKLQTE